MFIKNDGHGVESFGNTLVTNIIYDYTHTPRELLLENLNKVRQNDHIVAMEIHLVMPVK